MTNRTSIQQERHAQQQVGKEQCALSDPVSATATWRTLRASASGWPRAAIAHSACHDRRVPAGAGRSGQAGTSHCWCE